MRRGFLRFAVPLVLMGMVAAACSNNNDNSGSSGATGGTGASGATGMQCNADIKVGIAFDVGGIGDKSFNDAANAGLQKAIADGLVCEENPRYVEANADGLGPGPERAGARRRRVRPGRSASGFAFSPGINTIAPRLPRHQLHHHRRVRDLRHRVRARRRQTPNVVDLTFKEQEGSFLVGVAAALKAQKRLRHRRLPRRPDRPADREVRGRVHRRRRRRSTRTSRCWSSTSVTDEGVQRPDQGRGAVEQDVRQRRLTSSTTRRANRELVCSRRRPAEKLAIGVDSDQYHAARAEQQPLILTSMLKRVDTAMYNTIKARPTARSRAARQGLRSGRRRRRLLEVEHRRC